MKYIVLGITTKAIGRKLGITERTTMTHIQNMKRKNNAVSKQDLCVMAVDEDKL